MAIVHIGVGSNLGEREDNCHKALQLLETNGVTILRRSSLFETEPWGEKDQPRFINMAVEGETSLSPDQLLNVVKTVERTLGRERTFRWGPRIIDLDILFYDEMAISTEDLCLPHPRIAEREFVLLPLSEITPQKMHPILGKTIYTILEELKHGKDHIGKEQDKD